jgi:hypothetical protein
MEVVEISSEDDLSEEESGVREGGETDMGRTVNINKNSQNQKSKMARLSRKVADRKEQSRWYWV